MIDPVEYTVSLSDLHGHLYEVEARFPISGTVDAKLPVWTPGSYLIREYARHVQDLIADDDEGRPLAIHKIDKASWRIDARAAGRVRLRYRVYAYELSVRTAYLDAQHGFWNGACLLLYVEALRARAARVKVHAPESWQVTVALESREGSFEAASYDELIDSPFSVGPEQPIEFRAADRPHRLLCWEPEVLRAQPQLCSDMTRIIETAARMFGDLPYPDYTFLLILSPNAYGGLEHARSCTLLASPFTFAPQKKYEDFLELIAHEYFHLWNGKRIRPAALGPFDYQREAYTRSLWVVEGITSYYDRYLLLRAGLKDAAGFLEKLAEDLTKMAAIPGRARQSLEEASFDAWIKLYRPDENTLNSTISYYLKGGVVALLLDLELRSRSLGQRTLDDVMRFLWQRFGRAPVGFPDDQVQALMEEAAGFSLDAFFEAHVRGRGEMEVAPLLGSVGLQLEPLYTYGSAENPPAWLGVETRDQGGRLMVAAVPETSPARAAALYAGDEIVALDGYRIDPGSLKERVQTRRRGETVLLTVFRRDRLCSVSLPLDARPPDKGRVVPVPAPTIGQRNACLAWLGTPLDQLEC